MSVNVEDNSMNATTMPDENGHFGIYGGRFVAETLMTPLKELEEAYAASQKDPEFQKEFDDDLYTIVFTGNPDLLPTEVAKEQYHVNKYIEKSDSFDDLIKAVDEGIIIKNYLREKTSKKKILTNANNLVKNIHIKMKEERNKLGLTQKQLAKKLGVTRGTIANYESTHIPPNNQLIELAQIFNKSVRTVTRIARKYNLQKHPDFRILVDFKEYGKQGAEHPKSIATRWKPGERVSPETEFKPGEKRKKLTRLERMQKQTEKKYRKLNINTHENNLPQVRKSGNKIIHVYKSKIGHEES